MNLGKHSPILHKKCLDKWGSVHVLRVCVPDAPTFWAKYLQIYEEELSKPHHERNAQRLRTYIQMFFNEIVTRKIYLGYIGHKHKWNFDEIQLIDMFERNGFSNVERMNFHKSRIPQIHEVERSNFLIVEGIKR